LNIENLVYELRNTLTCHTKKAALLPQDGRAY